VIAVGEGKQQGGRLVIAGGGPRSPMPVRAYIIASRIPAASARSSGRVDISWLPSGTRGYPDLVQDALAYELDDIVVPVASLADVIRSKEAAGRERDRTALPTLRLLLERAEKQQPL
jgi:hypothetical protein